MYKVGAWLREESSFTAARDETPKSRGLATKIKGKAESRKKKSKKESLASLRWILLYSGEASLSRASTSSFFLALEPPRERVSNLLLLLLRSRQSIKRTIYRSGSSHCFEAMRKRHTCVWCYCLTYNCCAIYTVDSFNFEEGIQILILEGGSVLVGMKSFVGLIILMLLLFLLFSSSFISRFGTSRLKILPHQIQSHKIPAWL